MRNHPSKLNRRSLLRGGMLGAAGLAVGASLPRLAFGQDMASMRTVDPKDRKLLFVFAAHGGAAVIDSFLPIVEGEVGDPATAGLLDVFPESLVKQVPGRNYRHVEPLADADYLFYTPPPSMAPFVQAHGEDLAVFCHNVSSVNHNVAQARSLNGAGANAGRTLMEAMALRYGGGMPLPNCNMSMDGFIEHGSDPSVPSRAKHETITAPLYFATGTHGYRGLHDIPPPGSIARARRVREQLDKQTVFSRTFANSPLLHRYLDQREFGIDELEKADLVEKLLITDPATLDPKYGLAGSAVAAELLQRMPELFANDVQAQVGLAFLLAYHGISTSVTLGMRSDPIVVKDQGVLTAPIAFDYCHSEHRATQSMMWGRLTEYVGALISLLKDYDYLGDPALGKMWDRSMVYIATDFGRTKERPSGAAMWGSGHHLNNGSVVLSPLIRGNRIYGRVDPKTAETYGFDRQTGEPDPNTRFEEAQLYGALAHALDIDYAGREDCPAWVRG